MARTPFFAANWKMYKTAAEAESFLARFVPQARGIDADLVIAAAAPLLPVLQRHLQNDRAESAGQNCSWEREGAFTGEVSPLMLRDAGARWVILGHSERRHIFGESDEWIEKKVKTALATGLKVILCAGETLAERDSGATFGVVERQLASALAKLKPFEIADLVVAYEPVWAIGTGRTATPEIAQEVHDFIRGWLTKIFAAEGEALRILYGGSVKPDNIAALMRQRDIDGALVGGASLDADSFLAISRQGG